MDYKKAKNLFINQWPFRAFPSSINIDTGSEILHCQKLEADGTCELIGKNHAPIKNVRKALIKKKMATEILNKEEDDFPGVTEWFLNRDDCRP